MAAAVALLVAVLFFYFLAKSQPFRSLIWKTGKVAGVVGVLALAAVGSYVLYQRHDEARRRTLIKPSEIVLSDLTFTNDYGTSYKLAGTVKNTSRYALHSIGATFVIRDCEVPFDPDKYLESKMMEDLAAADAAGDKKLAWEIAGKIKALRAASKNVGGTRNPVVSHPLSPDETKVLGFDKYPDAGMIYWEGPDYSPTAPITCDTIGESTETVYVNVPAGQVRAVSDSIHFLDLPLVRHTFGWMLVVNWVEAS